MKQTVQAGVYLIKPNLGELSSLIGKEELNIELVDDAAREVINKWKCEVVVVSMGAMLVTKDLAMHILPPAVKIKSTVGAGDSMVAGIVLSLSQNKSLIEAARYGVACGTAATMNPGTELCRKEDADHLYKLIRQHK
ncbi:MAG TPA: PfkB family carbohydrate kinase [Chitinophagaceae bacterium]|nr:PfkB family carbohydrate kinase [Chitinophagaceae bacterium]